MIKQEFDYRVLVIYLILIQRKMLLSRTYFSAFTVVIAIFAFSHVNVSKSQDLESESRHRLNWTSDFSYRDKVRNAFFKQRVNSSFRKLFRGKRSRDDLFDPNRRGGLVCSLCLVLDEQFTASRDLIDRSSIVSVVYNMVDRMSWIFRNIDWNDDGTPDNFGFEIIDLVTDWNPYPEEAAEYYDDPKPAMQLLAKFAEIDFRSCCLGVGMTNRPFQETQVGVSFIASQKLMGGICDYRNPPSPMISPNSALISGRGVGQTVLSLKDVETILLHELGHTFGVSMHDRDIVQLGSPECSGYLSDDIIPIDYVAESSQPPKGRYIMWGQELQGSMDLKVNHLKFSPCSRRAVMGIFQTQNSRSSCLKVDKTPFCGNGRLEHPEECDCGNEISCSENKCCGPRGSTSPCKLSKGNNSVDCMDAKANGRTGAENSLTQSVHAQIRYGLYIGYVFLILY